MFAERALQTVGAGQRLLHSADSQNAGGGHVCFQRGTSNLDRNLRKSRTLFDNANDCVLPVGQASDFYRTLRGKPDNHRMASVRITHRNHPEKRRVRTSANPHGPRSDRAEHRGQQFQALGERRVSGSSVGKIIMKMARMPPGLRLGTAGRFYYPRKEYENHVVED